MRRRASAVSKPPHGERRPKSWWSLLWPPTSDAAAALPAGIPRSLVCDHAAHLARLGDSDPLGIRKAKALGLIADTQTHLDLHGTTPGNQTATETNPPVRRPSLAKTRLYLHLGQSDLIDPLKPTGAGEVEKLGPATQARIRDWLDTSNATIVPVLDMKRDEAVDQHDPPPWMRETVILRDGHCVFPWCRVDARSCDLDHITP